MPNIALVLLTFYTMPICFRIEVYISNLSASCCQLSTLNSLPGINSSSFFLHSLSLSPFFLLLLLRLHRCQGILINGEPRCLSYQQITLLSINHTDRAGRLKGMDGTRAHSHTQLNRDALHHSFQFLYIKTQISINTHTVTNINRQKVECVRKHA